MKLTLRKANAVQNSINEMIKTLDLNTTVTLNEFEDVADQIEAARDRFWANHKQREDLMVALYNIRAKVAQANAAAGINDLLTEVAFTEKQIAFDNQLASKGVRTALRVLSGQVKKNAATTGEASYYRAESVSTSIFAEEEIVSLKNSVKLQKKAKQGLQDRLLELNVKTEIELEDPVVSILTEAGIV